MMLSKCFEHSWTAIDMGFQISYTIKPVDDVTMFLWPVEFHDVQRGRIRVKFPLTPSLTRHRELPGLLLVKTLIDMRKTLRCVSLFLTQYTAQSPMTSIYGRAVSSHC
jgi:hypothetical protein